MNEEQKERIDAFEQQYERTVREDGKWFRLAALLLLLAIVLNAIGKAIDKSEETSSETIPEPLTCASCGTEMPEDIPANEIHFCYRCGTPIGEDTGEDTYEDPVD